MSLVCPFGCFAHIHKFSYDGYKSQIKTRHCRHHELTSHTRNQHARTGSRAQGRLGVVRECVQARDQRVSVAYLCATGMAARGVQSYVSDAVKDTNI